MLFTPLPRKLSQILSLFILRGYTIDCIVTGGSRYSKDLPQGGLENPCKLFLVASKRKLTNSDIFFPVKLEFVFIMSCQFKKRKFFKINNFMVQN